jgi:SAM-dependent methyltransferase
MAVRAPGPALVGAEAEPLPLLADDDVSSQEARYGYTPDVLPAMVATCRRQRPKDSLFVEALARWFRPGRILEIGAGCGQLSELLKARGFDVTPSDVAPFLTEYMAARGLAPLTLDALDLASGIDRPFENVLSQSISTLITRDEATIARTYQSVWQALVPGGRFVFILPAGFREEWSSPRTHLRIAADASFEVVRRYRHQALPSSSYSRFPRWLLRLIDGTIGRVVGVRWVFVFQRRAE